MWNNHDFDDTYLIQTIVWKMEDMLYQLDVRDSWFIDLRHQDCCEDNVYGEDMLKSLEECIEIGNRLIEDEYVTFPNVVEDWFAEHSLTDEAMPEDLHNLFIGAFEDAEKRKEEDNEKFFDIMKKHHWGWWS
jgi:hypothetical protein